MGGVATAVTNSLRQNTVKVGEGKEDDEYLITRLDHVYPPINVVNVYGGQESRMTKKEILENWLRLRKDIDLILKRKEGVVLIGDFNVALGNDDQGIKGNKERVSYGGHLIREMLKEKEIILVNSLEMVEGGPWTWESRSDPTKKSCLDLVMVSENLVSYISSLLVDTKRDYAPFRVAKKKGRITMVRSDHYTLVLKLKNLPKRNMLKVKQSHWNLKKPNGWENYEAMTEEMKEKADAIIENRNIEINEVMDKVDKLQDNVKFKAFGKTKPPTKTARLKKKEKPAEGLDDQEKAKKLLEIQSQQIEEEINRIKMMRNGKTAKIFKMRELVSGSKMEPSQKYGE